MFVGNADLPRVPELAHLDLGRLKQVGKDGDSSAQQREGLSRYAESARLIVCQQGFEEMAHGHPESRSIRTVYQYRLHSRSRHCCAHPSLRPNLSLHQPGLWATPPLSRHHAFHGSPRRCSQLPCSGELANRDYLGTPAHLDGTVVAGHNSDLRPHALSDC